MAHRQAHRKWRTKSKAGLPYVDRAKAQAANAELRRIAEVKARKH